jgi:uncharacterized protein (DUF1778 family)
MAIPNKTETVAFRVTRTQARLIRACAEEEGVRLSDWLRRLALQRAAARAAGAGERAEAA